jgi:hypothetical protein
MKEITLILLGSMVLFKVLVILMLLNEPAIFLDKKVEVIIALGIGLLILVLIGRANNKNHQMVHRQYELIEEIHRKPYEPHEPIKRLQYTS